MRGKSLRYFAHSQGYDVGYTLYINDQAAGSKHFAPPVPFNSWEGLDIGRDLRTAVSKAYKVPFTFEGHIESVNYDIH